MTTDAWSCPDCGHTEHLQVVTTWDRAVERLRRVRDDHGAAHARAARTAWQQAVHGVRGDQ